MGLVEKFQEKLEVSRKEAVARVIVFTVLSLCCLAVIAIVAIGFPYAGSYNETVALLPGDHVQVKEILDGEVLVDEAKFLQVAKGNTTFVELGEETIVYLTKVAGVSYRYEQTVPLRDGYKVSTQHVEGGTAVREINRKTGSMVYSYIFFSLGAACFSVALYDAMPNEKNFGLGKGRGL